MEAKQLLHEKLYRVPLKPEDLKPEAILKPLSKPEPQNPKVEKPPKYTKEVELLFIVVPYGSYHGRCSIKHLTTLFQAPTPLNLAPCTVILSTLNLPT